MSIKKLKDWKGWFDGLRSVAMKAGAEAVFTNLSGLIATNGVAATIPALDGLRLHWQTAILTTVVQFGIRTGVAAAKYVMDKPDPDLVEVEIPTVFISKPTEPKP